MTKYFNLLLFLLLFSINISAQSWIRINYVGYEPNARKVAVLISKTEIFPKSFSIHNAITDEPVFTSEKIISYGKYTAFTSTFQLDFSGFQKEGSFYITLNDVTSDVFKIASNVYDGTLRVLTKYMRQQRCGYNPFLDDSCHTLDGFITYHPDPELDSTHIDVTGGWHDASDYLQYLTTSGNATYQLFRAYLNQEDAEFDYHLANGLSGKNSKSDLLDEAIWGLQWMLKMNPDSAVMFNQIADDRDHLGFRLPTEDPVDYGFGAGKDRPIYFCTGEPQGIGKHQNRADGLASTAGKFASVFALASRIFEKDDPEFSNLLKKKAIDAYAVGKEYPGVCQTAPCRAPYFYEEDNYVDDMQLAATELFQLTGNSEYYDDALSFASQEPVTPWMGADTARHYQWYPFFNIGHFNVLTIDQKSGTDAKTLAYIKEGLERIKKRGEDNPFLLGIPFIWCSNNLVTAAVTQATMYRQMTGDSTYYDMECALRDWIFGCNPWGTSMVVGYPEWSDYPIDPHSAFTHQCGYPIDGGIVDGPVYGTIFRMLKGLHLSKADEYAEFQSDYVVYHDDYGDYSTNEPTMDGTASLILYLSLIEKDLDGGIYENAVVNQGAIVRSDTTKKNIILMFTGHEYADGYETIRDVLKKHNVNGMFFFTGDFYRNPEFKNIIETLKSDGHYIGAHSDQHLLYADWEKRDSTLVKKNEFQSDLKNNYAEMGKYDISRDQATYYLPPFEWYNKQIAAWTEQMGLTLINNTYGTLAAGDYTTPDMGERYYDNEKIYKNILTYEEKNSCGLNGYHLLTHIGKDPKRPSGFYKKLDDLLTELASRGYSFTTISLN